MSDCPVRFLLQYAFFWRRAPDLKLSPVWLIPFAPSARHFPARQPIATRTVAGTLAIAKKRQGALPRLSQQETGACQLLSF